MTELRNLSVDIVDGRYTEVAAGSTAAQRCFLTPYEGSGAKNLQVAPGTVIDRFVIKQHLARGWAGSINCAFDQMRQADVALKIVETGPAADPGPASRLRAEAAHYARIMDYRHIIRGYELHSATLDGRQLLILSIEYAEGGTLTSRLCGQNGGDGTLRELAEMFLGMCQGVKALHDVGLIHADLHPDNLLIVGNTLKVADLGSVVSIDESPASAWTGFSVADDIRSLGTILAVIVAHATGRVPPMVVTSDKRPTLSAYVEPTMWQGSEYAPVISRCLATDKAVRYSSVDQLITDVAACLGLGLADAQRTGSGNVAESPETLWSAACRHLLGGYWDHAEHACTRLLAICPGHRDGMAMLAQLATRGQLATELNHAATDSLERGDVRESMRLAREASILYPRHTDTAAIMIRIAVRTQEYRDCVAEGAREQMAGRLDAAIVCYARARELNRSNHSVGEVLKNLQARRDRRLL